MKVTTVIQNVQRINDLLKLKVVRNYYMSLQKDIDILYMQEHHLWGSKLAELGSKLWSQVSFHGREASIGFGHNTEEARAGKEGVCLRIASHFTYFVTTTGHSPCKKAQRVYLSGVLGGNIVILHVYASNNAKERCALWELLGSLPCNCRWLLCGN